MYFAGLGPAVGCGDDVLWVATVDGDWLVLAPGAALSPDGGAECTYADTHDPLPCYGGDLRKDSEQTLSPCLATPCTPALGPTSKKTVDDHPGWKTEEHSVWMVLGLCNCRLPVMSGRSSSKNWSYCGHDVWPAACGD